MTIEEYLIKFNEVTIEDYLNCEKERIGKLHWHIDGNAWSTLLHKQDFKCFYCETHLGIIQQLVLNRRINPRKRGKFGFSGLHFELDHKDANNNNNSKNNLVASCYYCNNDKSNTISSELFKKYFGKQKGIAFKVLFELNQPGNQISLCHHLSTV
jgi:hypothetical protein